MQARTNTTPRSKCGRRPPVGARCSQRTTRSPSPHGVTRVPGWERREAMDTGANCRPQRRRTVSRARRAGFGASPQRLVTQQRPRALLVHPVQFQPLFSVNQCSRSGSKPGWDVLPWGPSPEIPSPGQRRHRPSAEALPPGHLAMRLNCTQNRSWPVMTYWLKASRDPKPPSRG